MVCACFTHPIIVHSASIRFEFFFLCVACVAFDSRMSAIFNSLKQTILDMAHANLMCLSSPHDLNLFTLTQFGTGRKDTQNVSGMNKITHSI